MPQTINSYDALRKTVIEGGYCIGCGACSVATGGAISILLDEFGEYKAEIPQSPSDEGPDVRDVCPFSDVAIDETTLGQEMFGRSAFDERLGFFRGLYAGHVAVGEFRKFGSSGGTGSWILATLLSKKLVDFVLHVKPIENGDRFAFAISSSVDAVIEGAKSRYFPIEMSDVLAHVKNQPGRYALIGLPCFVKAARLLARQDPIIAERIRYMIGLVCGHLKSSHFADFLAWQCGVPPGKLRDINFRHKLPDRSAMDYGVRVTDVDGKVFVRPVRELFGHQWGYGFFKYAACDFCDDVVGETADVTVGDAWLPAYENDPMGTNVVIARTAEMDDIIRQGMRDGELMFNEISAEAVAQSQAGGLRHRRAGLSYRLFLKDRAKSWRPPKRVQAAPPASRRYGRLQETRVTLREMSKMAFRRAIMRGDFEVLIKELSPLMRRHERLSRSLAENLARSWLRWPLGLFPHAIKQSLRRLLRIS